MSLPRAVLFDIDGTLALRGDHQDVRGWSHWHRVGEDLPNPAVVELAQTLHAAGRHKILVMSGRPEECRRQTELWLDAQSVPFEELLMRPHRDNRQDSVVKEELYRLHVQHRYDVAFVVDDRDSVVAQWRSMGIVCLQCNYGDF